ncbi:MAG: hypothetical protein ACOYUB_01120 [Patescibacteria group bacterium]
MKNFLIAIVGIALGLGLTALYLEYRLTEKPPNKTSPQPTSSFSIATPPSESLTGKILSRSGKLLWESRTATTPAELSGTTNLSQGERIITDKGSNAVLEFDRFGKIILSEESDLAFPQTLPSDFVVNQRFGKIKYEMSGEISLSIRMRTALVTKESGTIEISMTEDDPIILISTLNGTAKIGFNDAEGVSQVFDLREGQIYEYNSDERTAMNQNLK